MELIIWCLIGAAIEVLIRRHFFKEKPVGFLRIDRSDPDGPILFLELKEKVEDISRKKTVIFIVKNEDFIPHE